MLAMNAFESKKELLSLLEGHSFDPESVRLSHLETADTASDVAGYVSRNFASLYEVLGSQLCDFVRNSLPQKVWEAHQVLINPDYVINEGDGVAQFIVVSDNEHHTLQYEGTKAIYYGDVYLWINGGTATVVDSKGEIQAIETANVRAGGYAKVYADEINHLELVGHASAVVKDGGLIIVKENAFLESTGGRPLIHASDNAQYLISGGSPSVVHKDGARGVIAESVSKIKMLCEGNGVLFCQKDSEFHNITVTDGRPLMITGYGSNLIKERYIDAIIPRYHGKMREQKTCITEPLTVKQLAADLRPYLYGIDALQPNTLESRCTDELGVCQLISKHIPELVERGLNADFLRDHFTYETLVRSNIHVDEDNYHPYRPVSDERQYAFGNVFINALDYDQPIVGYENSVIAGQNSPEILVKQHSTGFSINSGKISASDQAAAFGANMAQIFAEDNAFVGGFNECKIEARGNAQVHAFDNAFVEGHDHNFITLFHNAKASVNDRCSVVCLSSNMVKATGDAQVAELTFAQHSKPTLTEESTVTNIIKLGDMREYEYFSKKWVNECDTGQYKSSGLRR